MQSAKSSQNSLEEEQTGRPHSTGWENVFECHCTGVTFAPGKGTHGRGQRAQTLTRLRVPGQLCYVPVLLVCFSTYPGSVPSKAILFGKQ